MFRASLCPSSGEHTV